MNKIIADRYEIIDLIGQGGMADVYLAKDTILNRTIAIKILRTSLAKDPVYITRFQREASAAAALSDKNIVEIYDVGEEGNQYYIVMEYVPGTTLKELILKRGALHMVEAVDIMKQVVSGVAKAHQLGIIHRDLKPQNILVTDTGTAKIADFGIASIQSLTHVTQTDVIMGSLHYLAPELARGEKATAQSDIYALGIVFYELLRGEVPFNGESPVNIALKHMQEDLPSLREFNPSILQSVENIIIKATAKNLNDRYHSAKEMLADLQTCLSRKNEEKLEFYHDINDEPTIVVGQNEIFDQEEEPEHLQREKSEDKKNKKKKSLLQRIKEKDLKVIIPLAAGIIAVLCLLMYFILFAGGNDNTVMPDLTGYTKEKAQKILSEYDSKISDTVYKELSDKYTKGKIIATNPKSGTTINKGDTVTLTVSKGKYIVVGNYIGMTYDEAKIKLKKHFNVEKEEAVSSQKAGTVIGQSLKSSYKQDPTEKDRTIVLTVSKGQYTVLDDYTGMTYDGAKAKLEALGFVVSRRDEVSDETAGTVINQNLAAGYRVDPSDKNRHITLTVSSGYSQTVPSVNGLSYSDAKSNLENLGFVVTLSPTQFPDDGSVDETMKGKVYKQSVSAGTKVDKKGTTITIYYYQE